MVNGCVLSVMWQRGGTGYAKQRKRCTSTFVTLAKPVCRGIAELSENASEITGSSFLLTAETWRKSMKNDGKVL